MAAVGKDIPHDSARGHVSGESVFIDDMPSSRNELIVDFVGAPVACGKLISLDVSEAKKAPGVVAIITAKEIPGHNQFGPIIKDEHLLVEDEIFFLGDPVCIIAAETREQLRVAKKLIKMQVEERKPIFSVDEAIAAKTFIGVKRTIECGDVDATMAQAEHTLAGSLEIGGQEHFYLESQAAIAMPGEHGQVMIHSSTQHPSEVQSLVAEIIGVSFNHVIVICKRMGGGFGGKETQAAQPAAMVALVSQKTRRPARIVYNKDDDMRFTGKRHPFKSWWKVGFTREGRITALSIDHYSNGGCTADLSPSVLERAMLHTDNAYFLPNARITGQVCRTNLPSNTAFRGFGGPQGVANIENIIEEIAKVLGIDAMEIRRRNCYGIGERNIAPYGQLVENNTLPQLFDELGAKSDYERRRKEIDEFNASSQTQLRGLAVTAVKFGISFTKRTLNQANALVNIYTDGTVMVSTGGTEMGQGVNTRVRQIVADELGVEYDSVIVAATSTEKNNNTSPTAASSGTDLNGAAAADACVKLRNRLAEFLAGNVFVDANAGLSPSPESVRFADGMVWDTRKPQHRMTFAQAVCRAYLERVSLGERGFYVTPGVDFNRETGKGHPFLYYTNGVTCSEVLIDRFTGEMKVTRVDLMMDLGKMINPGLDRGQAVGGFIQGMGWVTNEELKYNAKGDLLSHSPTTYKIPNIGDLPETFNVSFLDNPNCSVSLKGSKAMGEPPLLLGISVWAAAKNALSYLSGKEAAKISIPATGEQLLMKMTDYEKAAVGSDAQVFAK
ncbi:MAG TPA: xanthine dehydrogenase molybdopterin binding subunit [Tepidisphaeraceae bacterium]|nr:xanthine dehydrogenase molybdopterin binding subunit [Tepidisphaeraceae bacterium]